jgi:hypothetical protein
MWTAERLLKMLLIGTGVFCGSAIVPLFMPRGWMVIGHEWLGMGRFPDQPVAEYLARLTSGMYAFYGGLVLLLARDVRRNARVITYQAIAIAALAVVGLFYGGMPRYWLLSDFSLATGTCAATLLLQWKIAAKGRRPMSHPMHPCVSEREHE